MKIYFAGSIRGGRDDKDLYLELINYLAKYGEVLTEHIGEASLLATGEAIEEKKIFERDMQWVKEADTVVAEVTTPSLGVGYELGQAEAMGKSVLCLFRTDSESVLSAMVCGNKNLEVADYDDLEGAKQAIDKFFSA